MNTLSGRKLLRYQQMLGEGWFIASGRAKIGYFGRYVILRASRNGREYSVALSYDQQKIFKIEELTPFEVREKMADNPGPYLNKLLDQYNGKQGN